MLQKAKSTLLKVLICVCLVCCLVAMFVAVTACNKTEAPTVVGGHVDTNGHLILEMSDGSTSDAGLVAQPGTPGTNGTNGANGVGIENVTINNDGDLVITLDNDKEIVVKIPDYSVNCVDGKEHVWVDLHKVVDANCISGETWLTVCRRPGCNAMYLSQKGDPNPKNHLNLQPYGDPATCTKAGRNDQQCQDCGEIVEGTEVPAKGHTPYIKTADKTAWRAEDSSVEKTGWVKEVTDLPEGVAENWVPVVDDLSVFCVDGGEVALVCADCHEEIKESEHRDAPGHLITGEWTITKRPTEDETGLATGTCGRCGQTTLVLPKLSAVKDGLKVWTTVDDKKGTCDEDAKENRSVDLTYVYNYAYLDAEDAPQTYQFKFTETVDVKHKYTIDDVETFFQTGEISGTSPVYDDNDAFDHFGNSHNDCTVVGFASFKCETCGKTILIRVRGTNHDLDKNTVVSKQDPTCTEAGWIEYNCKNGAEDPATKHTYKEPVKALGHDWKVIDEESDFTKAETDHTATIALKCKRCGEPLTVNATNLNTERIAATCEKAGKVVYTYDYTPEGKAEVKGATTEIVLPQLFHTVTKGDKSFEFDHDHVIIPDKDNEDAVYELEDIAEALGYESISALLEDSSVVVSQFGNSHPSCTEPGYVSFMCSAGCGKSILVAVRGEHDWKPDPEHDVKASCAGDGNKAAKAYVCKNDPEHTKKEEEGEIPAHQWKAELGANNKITFTCQVCGKKVENVELDTTQGNNGILKKEPTCKPGDEGKGSVTYFYKDPAGKAGSIEVVLPRNETHKFHTLTGIYDSPDELQKYTVGQFAAAGTLEEDDYGFGNSHPTCKQEGFITIKCTDCGTKLVIKVKGDHTLGEEKEQAPTCTEKGYTYQECSVCQEKVEKEGSEKAALGHTLNIVVEVQPTVDQVGSAKVTCSSCTKVNATVELPKLSDTTFWKSVPVASSCTVPGSDTYTHEFNYDGTKKELTVVVERDLLEHDLEEKLLDWYSEDTLTHYWGHLCKKCGQLIVDHKEKLVQLTEPEEGEYYLSYFQAKLNDGKGERRYFTGKPSGFYYATSADIAEAAVVTLQKSGEDGWVIKVGEQFLEIVKNEDHYNVVLSDTQTEGVVWKWNASVGVFTVTIGDGEYYLGTYDNFNTVSASNVTRITGENAGNRGVSQFVAVLATLAEDAAE